MTKLLRLDSGIQGASSVSRILSTAAVSQLTHADPSLEVVYRDLVDAPLPYLTLATFGEDEAQAVLVEFMAARVVVIGASMYNFTAPGQLKSWINRIFVAGQTFRYGRPSVGRGRSTRQARAWTR